VGRAVRGIPMKSILTVGAALLAGGAWAQMTPPANVASIWGGKGAKILGSGDVREGGGLSFDFARREPHFSFKSVPAQLVYEGYVDYTDSVGSIHPRESTYATGGLAFARWWVRPLRFVSFYADLGWGFQVATQPTYDLPSDINSTPMLDLGTALPMGKSQQLLLGFRFLHISNAGFVTPNRGQDEFFFTAGIGW